MNLIPSLITAALGFQEAVQKAAGKAGASGPFPPEVLHPELAPELPPGLPEGQPGAVWLYAGFTLFVLLVMALDLGLMHKKSEVVSAKKALRWTMLCIVLALLFVPGVWYIYQNHIGGMGLDAKGEVATSGRDAAFLFLQGWLLEYALSVDNIFVFAVIFKHFGVPRKFQHRVLTWGIIATLVMRGAMILLAVTLIKYFEPILYVAGLFLIYTAWKMLSGHAEEFDPDKSTTVKIVRKMVPVTSEYDGDKFFTKDVKTGAKAMTPLFLVLIILNVVDLVFAVDSIPAIVSITTDPFLIFTSNIFAILGLRSLYFVLSEAMNNFKYLGVSLAVVLAYVGLKMLSEPLLQKYLHWHPPVWMSLGVIAVSLAVGVGASLVSSRRAGANLAPPPDPKEPA